MTMIERRLKQLKKEKEKATISHPDRKELVDMLYLAFTEIQWLKDSVAELKKHKHYSPYEE